MFRRIQYNLAKLLHFPIDPERDRRVQAMRAEIEKVGGNLNFIIQRYEDGWTAECKEIKGIITGGINPNPTEEEMDDNIRDAIFTTFGIPPYLCNDELLRNTREAAPQEERTFAFT